jgi:hypothetical protein
MPTLIEQAHEKAKQAGMRAGTAQAAKTPEDAIEHLVWAVRLLSDSNRLLIEEISGGKQAPPAGAVGEQNA